MSNTEETVQFLINEVQVRSGDTIWNQDGFPWIFSTITCDPTDRLEGIVSVRDSHGKLWEFSPSVFNGVLLTEGDVQ